MLLRLNRLIAPDDFSKGLDVAREISHDVGQWQALHDLAEVLPVADLVFGGGILIIVVLIHAAGLRAVGDHVSRRVDAIRAHPTLWHADLLMSSIVFLLLALHLSEIFVWSAALVFSGLVPNWHNAGFFAGNTYTTIGYGTFLLPPGWEMVAPIMAISGLFTFGWTGSVLGRLRTAHPRDQGRGPWVEGRSKVESAASGKKHHGKLIPAPARVW